MKKLAKNNKIYIFPIVLVLAAGLGLFNIFSGPAIQWTPEKIEQEIFIGTAKVFNVQFVSKKDLEDVQIWITPELEDFVTAIPDSFDNIEKDKTIQIEIIASIPLDAPIDSYGGTIHLKALKQKGKEGTSKTFAKPLPVVLEIKEPTAEDVLEHFVKDIDPDKIVIVDPERFVVNEIVIVVQEETKFLDVLEIIEPVQGIITGFVPGPQVYKIEVPANTPEELDNFINIIKDQENPLILYIIKNLVGSR